MAGVVGVLVTGATYVSDGVLVGWLTASGVVVTATVGLVTMIGAEKYPLTN